MRSRETGYNPRVFKTAWLLETNSILIKSMVPTTAHRKYSFSKYRKDHDYSKVNSRTHTHTSNWLTDLSLFFFFPFCKVWNFFHKNFHTRLKVIKAKLWWHPGTDCRAPKWNVLPRDIELEVKLESNLQTRNGMHWLLAAVGHLSPLRISLDSVLLALSMWYYNLFIILIFSLRP